jgi:hypothetical protein
MTDKNHAQQVVSEITRFVNSYTVANDEFIAEMSTEHRTLQQSFTKLVLKWMEYCASIDYRYDDRNKASHDICKKMIDAFRESTGNIDPSDFLPMI